MAAPVLSKEDIEQIAGRVLSIYTEAYVPERHLCYQVNPEELADVLGLEVDYQIPSLDGSILGVTSPDEQYVPVYYDGEECYYWQHPGCGERIAFRCSMLRAALC